MRKKVDRKQILRTIEEFKSEFYPESGDEKLSDINDPVLYGISLARESLENLKKRLSKK